MGASGWCYYVAYQPDPGRALDELRAKVFEEGDYWWAEPHELGKSAADYPNRPRTEEELWSSELVQECGTHSILDVHEVVPTRSKATLCTVVPLREDEILTAAGVAKLTRAHVAKIKDLATERWLGRCAVLHDDAGNPSEIYFWGFSGD